MTPPDSGEVCGSVMTRVNGKELKCDMARGHDGAHSAKLAGPLAASGAVLLPLPLAQRILAALECTPTLNTVTMADLAAELRAAVERKP